MDRGSSLTPTASARTKVRCVMANSELFEILLLAMVAGVILFRLYSVLGRRTGNERPPQDRFQLSPPADKAAADNVVALPVPRAADAPSDPVARGLADIR